MKNDTKKFGKNLVYGVLYQNFTGKKPLHIRFDKIDGFIKIYDGIRYLVLLAYNEIYYEIKFKILEPELIHIILYGYKKY